MLHSAEHEEPEEYADQAISDDSGAAGRAKVLQNCFVESETDLIAAVGYPRSAEIHPRGHGGAGAENQPKAADSLDVRKQINESDQTHQSANRGAAKTQDPFLIAGTDGRQRHHEARDDRRIDTRIIEPDEDQVANEGCHRALDGKADILGVLEGIREKQRSVCSGSGVWMSEDHSGSRHPQS